MMEMEETEDWEISETKSKEDETKGGVFIIFVITFKTEQGKEGGRYVYNLSLVKFEVSNVSFNILDLGRVFCFQFNTLINIKPHPPKSPEKN